MIQSDGNTYLPAYDAMGNLHALMTAGSVTLGSTTYSAGDIVAAYGYDAFGRTLRESGAYAGLNPFRFSTKYTDVETDLVYYGHRYYSSSLGRFINRDPKEEQGGVNLYTFVLNNPIDSWDVLGELPQVWGAENGEGVNDGVDAGEGFNPSDVTIMSGGGVFGIELTGGFMSTSLQSVRSNETGEQYVGWGSMIDVSTGRPSGVATGPLPTTVGPPSKARYGSSDRTSRNGFPDTPHGARAAPNSTATTSTGVTTVQLLGRQVDGAPSGDLHGAYSYPVTAKLW